VISAAENSNKFQKTRFWKEESVEDVVTHGPTAQATLVYLRRKVVCFVVMRSTEPDASDRVLRVFGKLSTRRGASA
jgi:hypothetical protein